MRVPGSNVLSKAMRIIASSTIQWFPFAGRVTNEIGLDVSTFGYPFAVKCSVQPVPRSSYQAMGLDFNKEYINVFAKPRIEDLQRNRTGDQLQFNGFTYQVMSNTQWQGIDGWQQSLAVKLDPLNE